MPDIRQEVGSWPNDDFPRSVRVGSLKRRQRVRLPGIADSDGRGSLGKRRAGESRKGSQENEAAEKRLQLTNPDAAGDTENLAGDVAAFLGRQQHINRRNLHRLARTAQRNRCAKGFQLFFRRAAA